MIFAKVYVELVVLDVPDYLKKNGPQTAETIAQAIGVHAGPLFRSMRLLSSFGFFNESINGTFSLTDLGDVLTEGHPYSQKALVKLCDPSFDLLTKFRETLKTNIDGSILLWNKPMYDYFEGDSDKKLLFGQAMVSLSSPIIPGILKAYDYSKFKKIIDVGGSMGHLIRAILRDPPNANVTGILFDRPNVIELAKKVCSEDNYDYKNRLDFVAGDYTKEIPKADAIIVKYCVHNTNTEQTAIDLLTTCHKACEPNGKLLLIEIVMPEIGDTSGKWDKCLDILMLVMMNAKERTLSEFKELGLKSGWKFNKAIPVENAVVSLHVIEFDKV